MPNVVTPLAAPACLHTPSVQFLADLMHTHARNNGLRNEADNVLLPPE